jgi:ABC-type transport system substrate-binding protein
METSKLTRRSFIGRSAVVVGGVIAAPAVLEACAPAAASTAPSVAAPSAAASVAAPSAAASAAAPSAAASASASASGQKSAFGVPLPADAGPKEQQYTLGTISSAGQGWRAMDALESIYASGPAYNSLNEPLVRVDKDWKVIPGQAEKWEVSADGMTWTFHLKHGLLWTNGDEVTADDYVSTFKYAADPKHAWDFSWYYDGIIKNFGEAARGTVPTSDVGIAAPDKYTVVFTTTKPVPYLPAMLIWSAPMHAKSLVKYGSGVYNTDPKTAVVCGPYMLQEFSPDRRVVMVANTNYTGTLKPMTDKIVSNIVTGGSDFARYQNGEIDSVASVSVGDVKAVLADPALKAQFFVNPGDFRCYYLFFDITKKPFTDKNVRLAFAKAVDRDAIVQGILAPTAVPAYTWLMPGFPDANEDALKSIQAFDPAAAKDLLAKAGYPNGDGFPKQTLIIRGGGPDSTPAVTQAVVASINQVLGVQIDLQTMDQAPFMTELLKHPTNIPFGWVTYGMDYLDATNMLSVWKSGGRHNWNNAAFDKLVTDGGAITNDPAARTKAMQDAERLLVEDAPGVFVYHPLVGQLQKPYRKGSWKDPNSTGYTGAQWPGEGTLTDIYDTLYQGADVTTMRKA